MDEVLGTEEEILISSDHIFHIGSLHLRAGMPCQDYATSGAFMHGRFAIVADGCSTGGRTDIGSRVTALATARALAYSTPSPAGVSVVRRAYAGAAQAVLGLANEDLFSTCAYAVVMPEIGSFVHIAGDGVYATETVDGDVVMARVDWDNNMPAYPAYAEDDFYRFKVAHGGDIDAKVATVTVYRTASHTTEIERLSLRAGIEGVTFKMSWADTQLLRYIGVFSDGVTQVDGVDWKSAVLQLLDFRSLAGEFAKRRMRGFLKGAASVGKGPLDDIAYAAIQIGAGE